MICLRSYDGRLGTQTQFSRIPKLKLFPLQEETRRLSSEVEVWWRETVIVAMSFTEIKVFLHSDSLIQESPSICQMLLSICTSLISLGHYQVYIATPTKSEPFPRYRARAFWITPGFWFSRRLVELSRKEF